MIKSAKVRKIVGIVQIVLILTLLLQTALATCTYEEIERQQTGTDPNTGDPIFEDVAVTHTASGAEICGVFDQCESQKGSFDQNDWTATIECGKTTPNDPALPIPLLANIIAANPSLASQTNTDRLVAAVQSNGHLINIIGSVDPSLVRTIITADPSLAQSASTETLLNAVGTDPAFINILAPANHCRVLDSAPDYGNNVDDASNLVSCMGSNANLIDALTADKITDVLNIDPTLAGQIDDDNLLRDAVALDTNLMNTIEVTDIIRVLELSPEFTSNIDDDARVAEVLSSKPALIADVPVEDLGRGLNADPGLVAGNVNAVGERLATSPQFLNSFDAARGAFLIEFGFTDQGGQIATYDHENKIITFEGSGGVTVPLSDTGDWTVNADGSITGDLGSNWEGVTITGSTVTFEDGFQVSGGEFVYVGDAFGYEVAFTNGAELDFNGNRISGGDFVVRNAEGPIPGIAITTSASVDGTDNVGSTVTIDTASGHSYDFAGKGTLYETGDMRLTESSKIWVDGTHIGLRDFEPGEDAAYIFTVGDASAGACDAVQAVHTGRNCIASSGNGRDVYIAQDHDSRAIIDIRGAELNTLTFDSTITDDDTWVSYAVGGTEVLLAGRHTSTSGDLAGLNTLITYTDKAEAHASRVFDAETYTITLQNGQFGFECPECGDEAAQALGNQMYAQAIMGEPPYERYESNSFGWIDALIIIAAVVITVACWGACGPVVWGAVAGGAAGYGSARYQGATAEDALVAGAVGAVGGAAGAYVGVAAGGYVGGATGSTLAAATAGATAAYGTTTATTAVANSAIYGGNVGDNVGDAYSWEGLAAAIVTAGLTTGLGLDGTSLLDYTGRQVVRAGVDYSVDGEFNYETFLIGASLDAAMTLSTAYGSSSDSSDGSDTPDDTDVVVRGDDVTDEYGESYVDDGSIVYDTDGDGAPDTVVREGGDVYRTDEFGYIIDEEPIGTAVHWDDVTDIHAGTTNPDGTRLYDTNGDGAADRAVIGEYTYTTDDYGNIVDVSFGDRLSTSNGAEINPASTRFIDGDGDIWIRNDDGSWNSPQNPTSTWYENHALDNGWDGNIFGETTHLDSNDNLWTRGDDGYWTSRQEPGRRIGDSVVEGYGWDGTIINDPARINVATSPETDFYDEHGDYWVRGDDGYFTSPNRGSSKIHDSHARTIGWDGSIESQTNVWHGDELWVRGEDGMWTSTHDPGRRIADSVARGYGWDGQLDGQTNIWHGDELWVRGDDGLWTSTHDPGRSIGDSVATGYGWDGNLEGQTNIWDADGNLWVRGEYGMWSSPDTGGQIGDNLAVDFGWDRTITHADPQINTAASTATDFYDEYGNYWLRDQHGTWTTDTLRPGTTINDGIALTKDGMAISNHGFRHQQHQNQTMSTCNKLSKQVHH